MSFDDDSYLDPLVSQPPSAPRLWRVAALAAFFTMVAIGLSSLGERIPPDLVLLSLLAVVGVFCLFAIATGFFRFAANDDARTLSRAVADSLPFGALVTDRDGRIVYANAQYGQFAGGLVDGLPAGIPRLLPAPSTSRRSLR